MLEGWEGRKSERRMGTRCAVALVGNVWRGPGLVGVFGGFDACGHGRVSASVAAAATSEASGSRRRLVAGSSLALNQAQANQGLIKG